MWYAFALHRISGLLLALFLPAHFYVLAFALNDAVRLDSFLRWTEYTAVKIAEFGLVFLLAVHLFGGLRLMALEWLPWSTRQKTYAATAVATSTFIALSFFLSAL